MIRLALVASGCPSSPRRRGRSGARRSRTAGRSGATSPTRRPPATRCPSWPPPRRSSCSRAPAATRRVPFNSFYTGYRQSVARPDELIVAVEVPPVEGRQWFRKVGTRAAQAISKVVMAAVRAPRPRIALGSVAPTVIRLPKTEAVLAAGGPIEEARETLAGEIQPIDDIRSTAEYRRRVCREPARAVLDGNDLTAPGRAPRAVGAGLAPARPYRMCRIVESAANTSMPSGLTIVFTVAIERRGPSRTRRRDQGRRAAARAAPTARRRSRQQGERNQEVVGLGRGVVTGRGGRPQGPPLRHEGHHEGSGEDRPVIVRGSLP